MGSLCRCRILRASAAVVCAVGLLSPAPLSQWQTAVGGTPARDGRSMAIGPTSANLLWASGPGASIVSQAVVGGDLVVANRISLGPTPPASTIYGYELDTGAIRWQVVLPVSFPDSWFSRVTGIRDGNVYVTRAGNTNGEYLYALDPADGSIRWQSAALISEGIDESVSYAPNGDIIASGDGTGGNRPIVRIDHLDGSTVWSTPRICAIVSGLCDLTVFGDKLYGWDSGLPVCLTAWDLATGANLYSTPNSTGGSAQVALMVGPDGTIYATELTTVPSLTFFLVAYEDTGSALQPTWSREVHGVSSASYGVGVDGSIYAVSAGCQVMRLDPATGSVLDTSPPLPDLCDGSHTRIAVDGSGKVFVTNGSFTIGAVHVFTPDLRPIWTAPLFNNNLGGVALAADGTLIVCHNNAVVAYRTSCDGYFVEYGAGCAGSGGFVPELTATGCPTPGDSITLEVANGLGGAFGVFFAGIGTDLVPVTPSCSLQIGSLLPLRIPGSLMGAGAGNGSISVAATAPPGSSGIDIFVQLLLLDPGAIDGVASTNPLQIHIQ